MSGGTYWDLKGILSEIRSNYNCLDEKEEPYYRALSEAIRLVSAQPEIEERKEESAQNVPKDDLISRKAAIDAVRENTFRLTFAEEQGCEGHVAWSAYVVYWDVIEGELLELPSAQPERNWIPCSERLPEEGQDILAYGVFGDDERIIPANYGNGCWFDCHMNCSVGRVVAWMPLPKPYEGEQNGEENE